MDYGESSLSSRIFGMTVGAGSLVFSMVFLFILLWGK